MQNMNGKTALGLDNNVGALVCYLNICLPIGLIYSIIVLVTDKTNKLPRFHAFQSLLLTGALLIIGIVFGIVMGIFTVATKSPILGFGFNGIFSLVVIGLSIFMAIKAYQGDLFKLPVIGDMADKWSN
ncbi:MAG: DUF4870 domain-containing protein [Acidobacteria bacterium]|jgi:uncharacterized membrane protein|nr:DUF4870 domain-containing protein [Acidobacteriota bacterium]